MSERKERFHKVKLMIPEGRGVFSRLEVDGEELRGVTAVSFAMDMNRDALITVTLYADLLIEGEARIIKEWKQGLPWWRRLPYWLGRSA